MKKPKAILFDLDDTLISFEGVSDEAWEKCCTEFTRKHALNLSTGELLKKLSEIRKWYWSCPERHKTGRENLVEARREIVKLALEAFDITGSQRANELADNFTAYKDSLVCLFPNTIETLTKLRTKGYRLGLITNGSSKGQRAKLERFGLHSFFEIILIDQEVGFGKPDIRIYELGLKLLGLSVEDVWMVGDNLVWDIEPPKSMAIFTVWHDYKKAGLPANLSAVPDKQIKDISELLQDLC